jgi:hypothetical protein
LSENDDFQGEAGGGYYRMVRSNFRAERFVTYSVIKFEYYTFVTALFQQARRRGWNKKIPNEKLQVLVEE